MPTLNLEEPAPSTLPTEKEPSSLRTIPLVPASSKPFSSSQFKTLSLLSIEMQSPSKSKDSIISPIKQHIPNGP